MLAIAGTMVCMVVVTACAGQHSIVKPGTLPSDGRPGTHAPAAVALSDADFCVGNVTLASTREQLRAINTPYARRAAGFDYGTTAIDAYLTSDGSSIIALRGPVKGLCAANKRMDAGGATDLTAQQVTSGYGEPAQQLVDGDKEYWIYQHKPTDQALIFVFVKGKTDTVYITRVSKSVRLWYPLLGPVPEPLPIGRKDASIGPLTLGMDREGAAEAMGPDYEESALPPYSKYVYRRKGLEIQANNRVRALFLWEGSTLQTTRGVHVGSKASDVVAMYGEPRVFTATTGHRIWSYENLKDGVGLVFWVKDDAVTMIAVLDDTYQFRPEVE